jgi:hypothetical protein
MRRGAAIAAGAVLVATLVGLVLPWLTTAREVTTSSPVPAALDRLIAVPVAAGDRACVAPVTIEPGTRAAVIAVHGVHDGPPLRVTVSSPGYRSEVRVAGGYGEGPLTAAIEPPLSDRLGRLCIENLGPTPVSFDGTIEPRRASTTVDGHIAVADLGGGHHFSVTIALQLREERPRSIAARAGVILRHMTAFRPGFVTQTTVAALLVLLVLLAAAGAPWAYTRALAGDRKQ